MFFNPLTFVFILFFFFALVFFFVMVQVNLIALAFTRIGIPPQYVFSALFATLVGSFVNIPIRRTPQELMTTETRVDFFGFRYVVPVWKRKETILAVNLGGAIIPTLLSLYLIMKTGLWGRAVISTALMSIITYRLARPVPGLGIALPGFLPPLLAALIAVIVGYDHAPVIAYICGTLGTLIGADLLNLNKISELGAPVASIGGAGTFDGIFLNGILAVLLSTFLT
ncbi:MAG: DUF1614 domain-containing protein [Deltaproteobacteria bacterium]|nr:DUF1614 domain-containing protein [Deltaproteobacteria bacterium]